MNDIQAAVDPQQNLTRPARKQVSPKSELHCCMQQVTCTGQPACGSLFGAGGAGAAELLSPPVQLSMHVVVSEACS